MATYPSSGVMPLLSGNNVGERESHTVLRSIVMDFAKLKTAAGAAFVAADVIQALPVFAGEFVENIFLKVVTPSSNAGVVGVGDGSSTQGYLANTTATNSAAGTVVGVTAGVLRFTAANVTSLGKLYTADDTIDVLQGATPANDGVIEVIAVIRKIYPQ